MRALARWQRLALVVLLAALAWLLLLGWGPTFTGADLGALVVACLIVGLVVVSTED